MEIIFYTQNLVKIYRNTGSAVVALQGIDLEFSLGEFLIITGRSGSGKSTLLNLLGGLDTPTQGKVIFQGKSLADFREKEITKWRQENVGFIYQEPFLIPHLSALENVALPLQYRNVEKADRLDRAKEMLQRVGLGERLKHLPIQLSGGEAQRVSIARALVGKPKLVLADEPTSELDSITAASLGELLFEIHKTSNVSFIVASHDPIMGRLGTCTLELLDGKIKPSSSA